ncbi:PD-(D/E)XK nuclease superfamily protein [uncultured archaeon]|nr:PD-(D/E)XK nuclease superfamily protein [uncultured archaeon]
MEQDDSGTIIITDWKTSSRAYSTEDVDGSFQLTIYSMAAHLNGYGNREVLLRFDCLIKAKKPRFDQYYTVRTEGDRMRAVKRIQQIWEAISKGIFIPNDGSWKCKGCFYKRNCIEWTTN